VSTSGRSGAAATPAARRARATRWAVGVGAALVTAIGLVLMFLLAQATNNRALYERYYVRLFGINVVVAVLLVLVIGWVAFRLLRRLRQGKFGSRLLIKLAAIFALVGVVPGALVYVVSYQFVARSIESWFDVKVEGALDAGLNLGRATLDSLTDDLAVKTRSASSQLAQVSDASAGLMLERIRDQLEASDVVLWTGSGQLVASAGASRFQLNPDRPTAQQFRQVRPERAVAHVEGLDETVAPGAPRRWRACARWPWCSAPASTSTPRRATCRSRGRCRRPWWPTRSLCRRPTASTRSGRWRARACAACTSARSR
jgi:hypothetical protein